MQTDDAGNNIEVDGNGVYSECFSDDMYRNSVHANVIPLDINSKDEKVVLKENDNYYYFYDFSFYY